MPPFTSGRSIMSLQGSRGGGWQIICILYSQRETIFASCKGRDFTHIRNKAKVANMWENLPKQKYMCVWERETRREAFYLGFESFDVFKEIEKFQTDMWSLKEPHPVQRTNSRFADSLLL